MPCAELGGLTIAGFGAVLAPANLSARQAANLDLLTSGIYGPRGSTLSRSAALQSSLGSKLQARSTGSILYRTTWKARVTPSGRQICALRATPWKAGTKAPNTNGYCGPYVIAPTPWLPGSYLILPRGLAETLARMTATISGNASILSGWPTPDAHAGSGGRTPADPLKLKRDTGSKVQVTINHAAALAGWPTARQTDGEKNVRTAAGVAKEIARKGGAQDLMQAAVLSGWSTASSRDWKDTPGMATEATNPDGSTRNRTDQLPRQAQLAEPMRLTNDGALLTGCSAGMESGGQLDPEHSRWLMRLPDAWADCAPTAMRSTRKRSSNS